jgi:hypothetical protein
MHASLTLATAALWLPAPPTAARSCIDHAYEAMDLVRLEVRSGGAPVEAPPELGDFDELLNSGDQGRSLLFWDQDGDWQRAAKWFGVRKAIRPSPIQADYIEASSSRRLRTSCGYSVGYTPILPGRYTYVEEHAGDSQTGLIAERLTVSADRQRVTFAFSVSGRAYEAIYEVTCAYFDWERDAPRTCGPKEAHDDTTEPVFDPPTREPPPIEPPTPDLAEAPPPIAPRGCVVAPPEPLAALLLFGLLGLWRRVASPRRWPRVIY